MKITKPWNGLLLVTTKAQSKCGKKEKVKWLILLKIIKFTFLKYVSKQTWSTNKNCMTKINWTILKFGYTMPHDCNECAYMRY